MTEKKKAIVFMQKTDSENLIKFIFLDDSEINTSWVLSHLLAGIERDEIPKFVSNLCREAVIQYLERLGVKFTKRTEYVN